MEIKAYIEEVISSSICLPCILPAQHHADHAAGVFHIAEPCPLTVEGQVRETFAQIICLFHALVHMENRMGFSKSHCLFHKGKHAGIFPKAPPVDPANGIVLAVGIVIALLGIADLVAAVNHGNPLGKQQHCKGSPHLALPHLTDPLLPAWPIYAAVPGIIIAAAVVIALSVCLIVLVIIGNKVIQSKTVLAGNVIDHPVVIRIVTDPVLHRRDHILIAF